MEILSIIKESKFITAFHPSFTTFREFLLDMSYLAEYYVIAEHNGIKYSANFNKVLNRLGGGANSWSELVSLLTVSTLLGYKKLSPRHPYMWKTDTEGKIMSVPLPVESTNKIYRTETHVKSFSFDSIDGIEADFGSRFSPDVRNFVNLKTKLKDVIFKKTDTSVLIDFKNTIPVINSVCVCPLYYDVTDELYAPESTRYLPLEDNKNITLIDFSPVGNIETIRLYDCTRKVPNRSDKIEIILPTNKTIQGKTPFLVIGGRLYFPDEFYAHSFRSIVFNVTDSLNTILVSNRIYRKDYDNQFTISTSQMEYYINTEMWDNNNFNNFIILVDNIKVKTSAINLNRSDFSLSRKAENMLTDDINHRCRNSIYLPFQCNPNSLLYRNINKDIVDFTYVNKRSKDIIMINGNPNMVIPDVDIGYVENTTIRTYGRKISSSSFTLKNIFTSD